MPTNLIKQRLQERGASLPQAQAGPVTPEAEEKIRAAIFSRLRGLGSLDDASLNSLVQQVVDEHAESLELSRQARTVLVESILEDLMGYGPIQQLMQDPDVTEVMVNRFDQVYYEKDGVLRKANVRFRDDEHVRNVIQKIVGPVGRRIDESSPMVDARLPDGSRVNAVIPPVAIDGACLTIRRFRKRLTAEELVKLGTLDEDLLDFLKACVEAKVNIVVSGGAGSGKTTLLNVLSAYIPAEERIVTIEDSAELQLQQEHVVRLEARPPNIEGKGEITIRDLVRNALRMRPDRIIVGESRGPEALDMIQAMNTGHEGSMTTIHANSPHDAVRRLEVMILQAGHDLPHRAVMQQIASAIDLIAQVSRMRDGSRKVVAVSQVRFEDGEVRTEDLFAYDLAEKKLRFTGVRPLWLEKFEWRNVEIPRVLRGGEIG